MGWYGKEQVSKASEGRGMPDCVVLDRGLSAFHFMVTCAHLSWAQVVVDWVYLIFGFSDSVAPFASESFPVRSAHHHHFSVLTALMLRQRFSPSEASHVLQSECHSSVWKLRNTTIPYQLWIIASFSFMCIYSFCRYPGLLSDLSLTCGPLCCMFFSSMGESASISVPMFQDSAHVFLGGFLFKPIFANLCAHAQLFSWTENM